MAHSTPVLIAGAGIAGPALGVALRRLDLEVVIYEASDGPRDEAGLFLNLAPNGLAALAALDLGAVTDGIGFRNDRLVFQNDAGRVLADVPVGGVTMLRGALSRALREAAERAGVRFAFGRSLRSVEPHQAGVRAQFADGTEAQGCCLIGADGIHSQTRRHAFPNAPTPEYTGILNLGGVVSTSLAPTGTAMRMIFGRRAFFGYAVRPSGETYWFSNFAQAEEPAPGVQNVRADDYRDALRALHKDDPPEIAAILDAVTGPIGAYPIYDIRSLPEWHRGPICLIGDAAHAIGPHVGQGTSLAIEDAVVLARCLRKSPDQALAFAAFERQRRPRVEPVVKQSRQTGRQKVPTGWIGRKLRDLLLPIFLRQAAAAADRLYRSQHGTDVA